MNIRSPDDDVVDFMVAKALPCPFCGTAAVGQKAGEWVGLGCPTRSCPGTSHGMRYRGTADALARWNHRSAGTAGEKHDVTCVRLGQPQPASPRKVLEMIAEWRRGCSIATADRPEFCGTCTVGLIDAIESRTRAYAELIGEPARPYFVVEWLDICPHSGPTINRVSLDDWPEWSHDLRQMRYPTLFPSGATAVDNPIRPLFDPSVMPARDEEGMCCHPDLDNRWNHAESEEVFDLEKFRAAGWDLAFIWFEADADEAMLERYEEEGGPDVAYWTPSVPEGEGWQLVGIWDTEDMPMATYIRKTVTA